MDHGGVFEVDAEVDAELPSRVSGKSGLPSRAGERSLTVVEGGVGTFSSRTPAGQDSEDAPLLGTQVDGRERRGRDPPWEEEEQFKGRPWYRKPSVSRRRFRKDVTLLIQAL